MASQENASRSSSPGGVWTFEEFMDAQAGLEVFRTYLIRECGEEIAIAVISFW